MTLPISSNLLQPLSLSGKSPARALWVKKTSNLFRGVLELDCSHKSVEEISEIVRQVVAAEFSPGWAIPFAFGTVIHFSGVSPAITDIEYLIADRRQSKATWQWVIVVNESTNRVYGIHMWMSGYLTPVFEELLRHFENAGCEPQKVIKQPSKFWKRLLASMENLGKARRILIASMTIIVLTGLLYRLYQDIQLGGP